MSPADLRLAEPLPTEAFAGPPPPRRMPARGLVERPRLVRRLATSTSPVVALVAPAGYGKSALLAQWELRDARRFAWVGTEDGGDLVASLATALRDVGALRPAPVRCASDLVAAWMAAAPHVLVFDGAESLDAAAGDILSILARHVPHGSTLAVASRTEPPLGVGRLRTDDAVVELRARDLAMTEREACLQLRREGLRLAPGEALALARATEGWPAALHLAAIALRGQSDVEGAVARFGGADRLIADYVDETLLRGVAPEDVRLLEHTAPLDRLSGDLCDAVLACLGTGSALRRLSRSGMPLTALDRSEQSFRLHPLLGDALRARLRCADPARETEVHRRASAWHEREGDLDAALDHAISAGDADHAAELLWNALPSFVAQRRTVAVERWLDRLDDEAIAARPVLALVAATTRAARGDRTLAERWLVTAQHAMAAAPAGQHPHLTGAALALRAAIGRHGIGEMVRDAAQARALVTPEGPWSAVASLLEGTGHHLLGDRAEAQERLDEGARQAAASSPSIRVLCVAQLALLAFERHDDDQGALLAAQAREEIVQRGLGDQASSAPAFAASAFAHAHGGLVDRARQDAAEARRLLDAVDDPPPWFDAQVRAVLARVELRLSDAAAARSLLAEASRSLRQVPEATWVHRWIDDTWERADTFAAGAVTGPATLTTAELRVLRFLPSHLSFREIAAVLHVSANTVKTQAHAVYRKLSASSRSEAVARARAVGLVDG